MKQISELEQEFIRVKLYGVNRSKRPRSAEQIYPELQREWGDKSAEREKELNEFLQEVIEFGKEACELVRKKIDRDTLAYDSLEGKSAAHSAIASQFMLQCFNNGIGMLPPEVQSIVAPAATKKAETPPAGKKSAPEKPAPEKTAGKKSAPEKPAPEKPAPAVTINPADLMQNIMNNSFSDEWPSIEAEILKYRTWVDDYDARRRMEEIIQQLEETSSPHLDEAKKLLANGPKIHDLNRRAFYVEKESKLQGILKKAETYGATEIDLEKIRKRFENGKIWREANAMRENTCEQMPSVLPPEYDTTGPNPHFVGNLSPSPRWTVMVDETGNCFDPSMFTDPNGRKQGRFVAILIPQGSDLPAIGELSHAVENTEGNVMKQLDALLHTSSPCGILGITLDGMANAPINYWYNGLERLFDLILRLLPIEGETTRLDFYVEARGISNASTVQRSADSSLYRLAKNDQERALKFKIKTYLFEKKKTTDKVFCAWNGYVDTVANVWGGSREKLKNIISDYALNSTCLMEGSSQNLYEVMDDLKCGRLPKPEYWSELITMRDAGSPDSLVARLLGDIGTELRHSLPDWQLYLNHLIWHLDSKSINLWQLGKQISFLKKYQPDVSVLPPRIKLLWLTAKLAEANHRGAVVVEAFDKFQKLTRELYEEDAPLTCYATLHLAVTYTNAYRFKDAQKVIEDYLKLISNATWGKNLPSWIHSVFDLLMTAVHIEPASPAAIPGIRYFAQLISSHGQHEAFFGRNEEAVKFFLEANRLFSRLSDPEQAAGEISQTSAYLLTSLMDLDKPDPALLDATLKSYFGGDLLSAAHALAATDEPKDKYRLHILLRYILSGKAPAELKSAVLEEKANWKTAAGHPWEMIEFYRGLLLGDSAERMVRLKNACELCKGNDATLHVIQAVILGTVLLEDATVEQQYRDLVEQCASELPDLGEKRIAALREQPTKRRSALKLAEIVLPFNFR